MGRYECGLTDSILFSEVEIRNGNPKITKPQNQKTKKSQNHKTKKKMHTVIPTLSYPYHTVLPTLPYLVYDFH